MHRDFLVLVEADARGAVGGVEEFVSISRDLILRWPARLLRGLLRADLEVEVSLRAAFGVHLGHLRGAAAGLAVRGGLAPAPGGAGGAGSRRWRAGEGATAAAASVAAPAGSPAAAAATASPSASSSTPSSASSSSSAAHVRLCVDDDIVRDRSRRVLCVSDRAGNVLGRGVGSCSIFPHWTREGRLTRGGEATRGCLSYSTASHLNLTSNNLNAFLVKRFITASPAPVRLRY